MKIAYVYGFDANPPKGGNRLHAFQLATRFLASGHALGTYGDDTIPGAKAFPRTEDGVCRLIAWADVVYLRVDGTRLGSRVGLANELRKGRVPAVWEINAPANENLAFSWLGGSPVPAGAGLRRVFDRAKRATHAARHLARIIPEERLRRRLARRAAAAICVSDALGRYARESLRIPEVVVLPNGSDPDLNHPGRVPVALPVRFKGRLKVLYAGSPIYPWQGLDIIMETIRLQRGSSVPMVFLLLVNQPLPGIGSEENVHVLESVPYGDVSRYINAADVCLTIHPEYTWSKWGFHGSPMKLFDYMACGRTVVASNVGQMRDVIRDGENGVLCANDPHDLLTKLEALADAPERRAAMGAAAREDVLERYNWDAIAARTLEIFHQVIETG